MWKWMRRLLSITLVWALLWCSVPIPALGESELTATENQETSAEPTEEVTSAPAESTTSDSVDTPTAAPAEATSSNPETASTQVPEETTGTEPAQTPTSEPANEEATEPSAEPSIEPGESASPEPSIEPGEIDNPSPEPTEAAADETEELSDQTFTLSAALQSADTLIFTNPEYDGMVPGKSALTVRWGKVSGADRYEVSLRNLITDELLLDHEANGNRTSYKIAARYLDYDSQYRFWAGAYNADGEQVAGGEIVFQTEGESRDDTLTFISPTDGSRIQPYSQLTVRWEPLEGAAYYQFSARNLDTDELIVERADTSGQPYYTIDGKYFLPDTAYRFWAGAFDSNGVQIGGGDIEVYSDISDLSVFFGGGLDNGSNLYINASKIEGAQYYRFTLKYTDNSDSLIYEEYPASKFDGYLGISCSVKMATLSVGKTVEATVTAYDEQKNCIAKGSAQRLINHLSITATINGIEEDASFGENHFDQGSTVRFVAENSVISFKWSMAYKPTDYSYRVETKRSSEPVDHSPGAHAYSTVTLDERIMGQGEYTVLPEYLIAGYDVSCSISIMDKQNDIVGLFQYNVAVESAGLDNPQITIFSVSKDNQSITALWLAVTGAEKYVLFLENLTDGTARTKLAEVDRCTVTQAVSLEPGKRYKLTVAAVPKGVDEAVHPEKCGWGSIEFTANQGEASSAVCDGAFDQDSYRMRVGETLNVGVRASAKGANLTRVTVNVDGYNSNNRLSSKEISGTNWSGTLPLDGSEPPLNAPGTYTIKLFVKTDAPEPDNWAEVDRATLVVTEEEQHTIQIVSPTDGQSVPKDRPLTVRWTDVPGADSYVLCAQYESWTDCPIFIVDAPATSYTLGAKILSGEFNEDTGTWDPLYLWVEARDKNGDTLTYSDKIQLEVVEPPKFAIHGSFDSDRYTMTVGEQLEVGVSVSAENASLTRVTINAHEYTENDRLVSKEISGTSWNGPLTLDGTAAPFNVPGTYTLKLFAKVDAPEPNNWAEVDRATLEVSEAVTARVVHSGIRYEGKDRNTNTCCYIDDAGTGKYYTFWAEVEGEPKQLYVYKDGVPQNITLKIESATKYTYELEVTKGKQVISVKARPDEKPNEIAIYGVTPITPPVTKYANSSAQLHTMPVTSGYTGPVIPVNTAVEVCGEITVGGVVLNQITYNGATYFVQESLLGNALIENKEPEKEEETTKPEDETTKQEDAQKEKESNLCVHGLDKTKCCVCLNVLHSWEIISDGMMGGDAYTIWKCKTCGRTFKTYYSDIRAKIYEETLRDIEKIGDPSYNLIENEIIRDLIDQRLADVGIGNIFRNKIINALNEADSDYANLFVYSFYRFNIRPRSGKALFEKNENTLYIDNNLSDATAFVVTFFHEVGHAIDWNLPGNSFYTNIDSVETALKNDVKNYLIKNFFNFSTNQDQDSLPHWLRVALNNVSPTELSRVLGRSDAELPDVLPDVLQFIVDNEDEFLDSFFGPHNQEEIPFESGTLFYEMYDWIRIDSASSKSNITESYLGDEFEIYKNGFMFGDIGGITDEAIPSGHDSDRTYWYKNGVSTGNACTEAFAEYFSAQFCDDLFYDPDSGTTNRTKLLSEINKDLFPETTKLFDQLIEEMLETYKFS